MSMFSERLKELRGPSSQAEMARQLNMKQQQYARYEKGITVPGIDVLELICRIHACSSDWLLGLKGHGGSVSVNAGSGAAVAIGTGARASAAEAKKAAPAADCSTCKYRKAVADLQAAGLNIKGIK